MQIGPYTLPNNLILAPMAGVTDLPFRRLCRKLGAGLTVSEMVHSNPQLADSTKTRERLNHDGEPVPISVQIAGGDPQMIADAAARNAELGAQIIDINMGCPAKKVCNKKAGSALLEDEALVQSIVNAAVAAVDVPVTLKIRTGPTTDNRNAERIAEIAEDAGIAALSIHGRTRACAFNGHAEYDTIARIKHQRSIPIIANGDITTPQQARQVLTHTGADGLMIGRAAQGNPWIFQEVNHFLRFGTELERPPLNEIRTVLLDHVEALHQFYGEYRGLRIARKHIGWYLKEQPDGERTRQRIVKLESAAAQLAEINRYFDHQSATTTWTAQWAA